MRVFWICLFGLSSLLSNAAGDEKIVSPHSGALGLSGVTHQGVWAAFHNASGLSSVESFQVGLTHHSRYFINAVSQQGLAIAIPLQDQSAIGISVSRYGYEYYNEQKAALAYARQFGNHVSASLQFDYLLLSISENYGKRSAFTAEAGLQAKLSENLLLGIHLYNPLSTKVADFNQEKAPVIFSGGLRYFANDKVNVILESSKDVDFPAQLHAGIEYHIIDPLILRTGIATQSTLFTFGASVVFTDWSIDASALYDQILGFSPQIGLRYGTTKKK